MNSHLRFLPGIVIALFFLQQPLLAQSIPAHIAGNYRGELTIRTSAGQIQTTAMQLDIDLLDKGDFSWNITYGSGGEDVRKYILKPADTATGSYIIDEQNSILLDAWWDGSTLSSIFDVQGSLLLVTYTFQGNSVLFEIIVTQTARGKISGGESGSDGIPPVTSYPVNVRQTATLIRS